MERMAVGNLDDNGNKVDKLAAALIENETLEKEEVDQLLTSSSSTRAEAI
jgi:hypothetical protein